MSTQTQPPKGTCLLLVLLLLSYVKLSKNSLLFATHPVFGAKADAKVQTFSELTNIFTKKLNLMRKFFKNRMKNNQKEGKTAGTEGKNEAEKQQRIAKKRLRMQHDA
ncbi:MAG: hypothetical protein IJ527_05855 [Prevotella sp.]|nr:hypothetical protein [Prevotella sp.]